MANVCQYWVEDPVVCTHWDYDSELCVYELINAEDSMPSAFPLCNHIGTRSECTKYEGTGVASRCILPDPSRHVGRRWAPAVSGTGIKWQRDWVTEYNTGNCDFAGTSTTCSGYSPYHMGFSSIDPDKVPFTADEDGAVSTTSSGLTFRMPLYYKVSNLRSKLSRCFWWEDESISFTIDSDSGAVSSITHACTNTYDTNVQAHWDTHKYSSSLGMWTAPCNGSKPECPRYTGVCWEHCVDSKFRQGDKVLAEQILELRYYLKRDRWTLPKYNASFSDPHIIAWEGTLSRRVAGTSRYSTDWLMPCKDVWMEDFNEFTVEQRDVNVITGTPSRSDYVGNYPTLVKELKNPSLAPIIRNSFDRMTEGEEGTESNYIFETSKLDHSNILIVGDTYFYNSSIYGVNLSDLDLIGLGLPDKIYEYDSIFEMRTALSGVAFDNIYDELSCKIEYAIERMPDKFIVSEMSTITDVDELNINANAMFYIGIPSFWGENKIFVFEKSSQGWEYDRIIIDKVFTSGVVGQTRFEVAGRGGVNYLPDYAITFNTLANNNGEIGFRFFPLGPSMYGGSGESGLYYVYDDAVVKKLDVDVTSPSTASSYNLSYRLYRRSLKDPNDSSFTVETDGMVVLGNAGYIMLTIPDEDKVLSKAIKLWEFDEDGIYLHYPSGKKLPMEGY